jgi:hypothetical protein
VSNPVLYTAVLQVAEETVLFVSRLLVAERRRRGIRSRRQAVLVLLWFLDGTRPAQLAADNACPGPVLPPSAGEPERGSADHDEGRYDGQDHDVFPGEECHQVLPGEECHHSMPFCR